MGLYWGLLGISWRRIGVILGLYGGDIGIILGLGFRVGRPVNQEVLCAGDSFSRVSLQVGFEVCGSGPGFRV